MTCERHGGNAGSIFCRECDLETIERESMTTPTPLTGIEAMTVMYQEEYELRVQKEKELAAALDLQAAYFARCEQLCDALAAAQERVEDLEVRCANAEARVEECERIITAMTQWLEREQLDVFRRGLWDAIAEGKKP